jgi:hypothetical protein
MCAGGFDLLVRRGGFGVEVTYNGGLFLLDQKAFNTEGTEGHRVRPALLRAELLA